MPESSLSSVLLRTKDVLRSALGLDDGAAMVEARVLASAALGLSTAQKIHSVEAQRIPEGFDSKLQPLLDRRLAYEPMAYITGHREFHGLDLFITNDVLVPRPETELLVDKSLELLGLERSPLVADLGTGSGAVAVAVGFNRPYSRVLGVDIERSSLDLARRNVERHRLNNVELIQSDWLTALPEGPVFDCIIANPPYLTSREVRNRWGDLVHEPALALDGGGDGLDAIRRIVPSAMSRLKPEGSLLVEHGWWQGRLAVDIFKATGYASITSFTDLGGLPRVTVGRKPSLS